MDELLDRTMDVDGPNDVQPLRSVEGWIVIVTGIHEEATEDELTELFSEFGEVTACHLNVDRRTGFIKGYALLEYPTEAEAAAAIQGADGSEFLDQQLHVDWAFVGSQQPEISADDRRGAGRRDRSKSPGR